MRRLAWTFAWVGVALWSLFALAAYGIVDLAGGLAMRNADVWSADPQTVENLFRFFGFLRGASVSVLLVVWGVVSLAILGVPWILDRVVGTAGTAGTNLARTPERLRPEPYRPEPDRPGPGGYGSPDGRDGSVVDLSPGEWSVGEAGARPASGPVPRVRPPR